MPNISADRKDLNAIARYAYGSGFFGEGEGGGRGEMGLLRGSDGRMRVIKFNTHWGEGGNVTQEQVNSSNLLRDQILALARSLGKSDEIVQRIRAELGLAPDNDNPPQTLLTRKVVARVVKMIDKDIWQNVRRTDDGTAEFNLAALKSRSGNMEFDSVRTERLGLEASDAVSRYRRNTFMSKTVSDAIKGLENLTVYRTMSPSVMKSFRFVVDETLKLWQEWEQPEAVERALGALDAPGRQMAPEKRRIKQQLENMVRVNFARVLIISGNVAAAKAYVRAEAKTAGAWETFRPLENTCKGYKNQLSGNLRLQKWFLLELNRFRTDRGHPWVLYGPTVGEDIREPLTESPNAFYGRMSAAIFSGGAGGNPVEEEGGEDAELQEKQKLWDDLDRLPKGFLPKRVIDGLKAAVSGLSPKFTKADVQRAFDMFKAPIGRNELVDRLQTAYGKVAPQGGADPRPKLDALLTKMQAVVFVNRLNDSKKHLTLERCVEWLEQNPKFMLQLDRRLKLDAENLKNLQEKIKSGIKSRFEAKDEAKNFGGKSQAGVFMQAIREYVDGELTVDGAELPLVPNAGFVMPKDGTSGTEGGIKEAATETLMKEIDNLAQRKLVSFLLGMADGLQGAIEDVVDNQEGMLDCGALMREFSGGGMLSITGNDCKRFCDMKVEGDGSIHLKMTVGRGLKLQMLIGEKLQEGVPLVNDSYDVEITIPKPADGFTGCPDFTVDSIKLSDVNTDM